MKKSIYVSFINGKSENKVFKAEVLWKAEMEAKAWILRNHAKIRKVDGYMLHKDGNVDELVVYNI